MKPDQVFELYEKLYFHEVDSREKIAGRLQIPLAILLSITSIFAIFLKGADFTNYSGWNITFFALVAISLIFYVTSACYFIRSFYGHSYEFIPSAVSSEKYRQKLITTYSKYSDCDALVEKYFKDYLFKYYSECATQNTEANDQRSEFLHKCNTYFVINLIPLILAFVIFTFASLDKNGTEKSYKVIIERPIKIEIPKKNLNLNNEVIEMTTPQRPPPPPPPPPPPKRVLREDVQIPNKPAPPKPQTPKSD
jgi:hypothetical protein